MTFEPPDLNNSKPANAAQEPPPPPPAEASSVEPPRPPETPPRRQKMINFPDRRRRPRESDEPEPKHHRWYWWALAAGATLSLAVAVITVYPGSSRAFCGSCHAAEDAADSHESSIHSNVACLNCHGSGHGLFGGLVYLPTLLRETTQQITNLPVAGDRKSGV